ncbi:MAG TPA: hypothetical protein VGI31_01775 [Streptosporangiaceae bacterium]
MTVQALPDAPRRGGFADPGSLPQSIAGWSLTRIGAGLWVSAMRRDAPADVRALAAEPGRLALVIDAPGPDQHTDALIGQLLPLLPGQCGSVRLVLAAGADRYADLSREHGLELLAAEAGVAVTPHGYAVVRSAGPAPQRRPPQWRRCLPGGDQQPAGVLAPSPAWEQLLAPGPASLPGQRLAIRRVPAGLALGDEAPDSPSGLAAGSVWPDPDRVTIVISGATGRDAAFGGLAELLPSLPLSATDGVRLYWPRAAAGDGGTALGELAARCGSDLIAPVADVSVSGYGGVCHGPVGAAPWLRFTSRGDVQALGSLYPEPRWEDALAAADFSGLGVGQVAAGLCVGRPGPAARGLAATARSIIPVPSGPTIVAGGDAGNSEVRRDVETLLGRMPAGTLPRLRLLLTGAGAGGHDSYAQFLADTFGLVVAAPTGRWTASPDGCVRALPAAGPAGSGGPANPWQTFSPRGNPPGQAPGSGVPDHAVAASAELAGAHVYRSESQKITGIERTRADGAVPQTSSPEPAAPEPAAPAVPEPVAAPQAPPAAETPGPSPAGQVALVSRDHRSSAAERLHYRESAARYQTHLVAVRRMLTQRPGLRSAASAEGDDAVVTDFAAVLDFLADDQRSLACAVRSPGAGHDPRVPCVVSGLRRLPSFTGAVFSSASLPPQAAGGYAPGTALVEPAFVYASSAGRVLLEGNVEYIIWSQTGKRVAALAADFGGDEIVFAAATAYKVLKADVTGSGPARVFLRESPRPADAAVRPVGLDEMDRRILERLMTAAAQRDQVAAEDRVLARLPGSTGQPIGLDARGAPFG